MISHMFRYLAICLLLSGGFSGAVLAQQAAPRDEATQKDELLDSPRWRQAMFELNEWLRTQSIYSRDQVGQIRADLAARVDAMSLAELQAMLGDLEAKLRILDTPQARATRSWFGQYLSVLAVRRRDEVLREIPDFATMTPAQLQQVLDKIDRRRGAQQSFERNRQSRVNAQLEANRAAQLARQNRPAVAPAPASPYRAALPARPFDDVQIGPNIRRTIDPYGRIWMGLPF
jgi:hypothetical protein